MRAAASGIAVLFLAGALAGCVALPAHAPAQEPGAGTHVPPAHLTPWFVYQAGGGFCGRYCFTSLVIFEDGSWLAFSFGHGDQIEGNATDLLQLGGRHGALVPVLNATAAYMGPIMGHETRYRIAVNEVKHGLYDPDAHRALRAHILGLAANATDPGAVRHECHDCWSPRVMVGADEPWDVRLAERDQPGSRNEYPQEAWFGIEERGRAEWDRHASDLVHH